MSISAVTNANHSAAAQQTQTRSTGNGYSFAQIMEKARGSQSGTAAVFSESARRAADVRAGLDAQTLAYLNQYAEIYNKYAARYGDGFELPGHNYTQGDAEGEAAYKKYSAIRDAFNAELYAAGIPGAYQARLREDTFDTYLVSDTYMPNEIAIADKAGSISALFYAEKYGLAGLSAEEQCTQVLGDLQTSSYKELNAAIGFLYHIGALSGEEYRSIDRAAFGMVITDLGSYYTNADLITALNEDRDWSDLLEWLDSESAAYALLSMVWALREKAEDEKLQAIYKKLDAQQAAIHEAIEYRIQKQREQAILGRADAELARLQMLFAPEESFKIGAALESSVTMQLLG